MLIFSFIIVLQGFAPALFVRTKWLIFTELKHNDNSRKVYMGTAKKKNEKSNGISNLMKLYRIVILHMWMYYLRLEFSIMSLFLWKQRKWENWKWNLEEKRSVMLTCAIMFWSFKLAVVNTSLSTGKSWYDKNFSNWYYFSAIT